MKLREIVEIKERIAQLRASASHDAEIEAIEFTIAAIERELLKPMYMILWSHGSGLELGGIFPTWDEAINVIKEDSPDNANIIRRPLFKKIREDRGGLYGVAVYDDGFFVGPDGMQLVATNGDELLEEQPLPPGPENYPELD